jgi:pSer/pThr/pTyr-binding forkhead associated (FHA) protein
MDDPGKDLPEEVSVEHDPTLAFEPRAGEKERGASGSRVEGAFAWALVVETGPQAGLSYVLGPGETIAGRGPDSDIFLGDVTVSREHARFFVDDHGLTLEDLGSTNGTYVNGDRVDAFALNPDDELIIGKFHLVVAQGSA